MARSHPVFRAGRDDQTNVPSPPSIKVLKLFENFVRCLVVGTLSAVTLFVFQGNDTTATVMSFVLLVLAIHRDEQVSLPLPYTARNCDSHPLVPSRVNRQRFPFTRRKCTRSCTGYSVTLAGLLRHMTCAKCSTWSCVSRKP
jgi:hypothetical protein